jgi:hypothetical protein
VLSFDEAESLAKTWVEDTSNGEAVIVSEDTLTRPYGWVFFYQSKKYLATQNALYRRNFRPTG